MSSLSTIDASFSNTCAYLTPSACSICVAAGAAALENPEIISLFFRTIGTLGNCLARQRIQLPDWKLSRLFSEHFTGETRLLISPLEGLTRHVGVINVDILARAANGSSYILREGDQSSYTLGENGEKVWVEKRRRTLNCSLGGKRHPDEDPVDAVVREVREELQLEIDRSALQSKGVTTQKDHKGSSYPGLPSVYTVHKYAIELPDGAYEYLTARGFLEVEQKGDVYQETTFFFQRVE